MILNILVTSVFVPAFGKRTTLKRSDLKSENMGLPHLLNGACLEFNSCPTNFLVFNFRPFLLSLKPIKVDTRQTVNSHSFRPSSCAVRNEDSRSYEITHIECNAGARHVHAFDVHMRRKVFFFFFKMADRVIIKCCVAPPLLVFAFVLLKR